jgi:hypothetical protein
LIPSQIKYPPPKYLIKVNRALKVSAIIERPKIANNRNIRSPITIPMTTGTACLKSEESVLETVAKTPGPGDIANKNIAAARPRLLYIVIILLLKPNCC